MFSWTHRRRKGSVVGGHHGEWWSGGRAPSGDNWTRGRAPGPWSGGEGGEAPPEAESTLVIGCPTEPANLAPLVKFSK